MSPRAPRVLMAIDSLRTGGAESMLCSLVEELAGAGGAETVVLAPSLQDADPELRERIERVARTAQTGTARLADPRLLRGIAACARAFGAELVHSHLSTATIASRPVAAALRIPHVTTIHTMPGPRMQDLPHHTRLDGLTSRLSSRLVAPTATIAKGYATRWRVPADRMRVIGNPPAAPPARGERDTARAALGVGDTERLVLCVSRLEPEKGLAELVDAIPALAAAAPQVRVAVAGAGQAESSLRARIDELGVADRIELLGRRSDIGELLLAADVFCLPSRHEGLPLSVLEAMRAGLPCVVTAVGGIPDVIADERSGLLVEPCDPAALSAALARVVNDEGLAARLGQAASEIVERSYAPAVVARAYADLYAELLGGRVLRAGDAPDAARGAERA